MIACTHHAAFDVWTLGLAKAVAALRLSMITICKLQASFLFTESHVLSLGLKCTDRSRWSLATVTSGHGHPSILGATAIVEHQPSPAFPPGDILSLIGYLGQKWTVKGFHAAFH